MIPVTIEDILKARDQLKNVIAATPTFYSPALSHLCGVDLFLKLENLQETGSFKERGAYIKLKSLSHETLKRGVIAVSAGNHGQAVAFHAQKLNIPATIVMPSATPPTKVGSTEKWGARVILAGDTLNDAYHVAQALITEENLTFVSPYDDPHVIAGQGTIGLEMLESCPDLDVILIPLGGGGLCSGVAIAAKHLNPAVEIYGVEVEGYASMAEVLYGKQEQRAGGMTLAEGIAVKKSGVIPEMILKSSLKDILIVKEELVEHAVNLFMSQQHLIVEGAGAVGLSALLQYPFLLKGKKVGLVVSGGNIDPRLVSSILIRGQIRDGRLVYFHIEVEDIPGTLERVAAIIAQHQGNILEVKHQRLLHEIPIKMTELDIVVETRGPEHIKNICEDLQTEGFMVEQQSRKIEKALTF